MHKVPAMFFACVPGHHYNHYCKRNCIPASEWQLHEPFCGKHHNLPDFNVVQPHTHGTKTLSDFPCISHMLPGSHLSSFQGTVGQFTSLTGIRTRAFGVRNRDPNQLDYEGYSLELLRYFRCPRRCIMSATSNVLACLYTTLASQPRPTHPHMIDA